MLLKALASADAIKPPAPTGNKPDGLEDASREHVWWPA